jgi:hypothetical protein
LIPVPAGRNRSLLQRLTRSILPQAIGKVTDAGIGPSEATVAGSLLLSTTPWIKTTRRSKSSAESLNALAKAAVRSFSETICR